MPKTSLLHELISASAERAPSSSALTSGRDTLSYHELDNQVAGLASGLIELGIERGERVGIFLTLTFLPGSRVPAPLSTVTTFAT